MSADLERLLNQREQMAVMKQVVLSLSQRESSGKHPKQNPIKLERLSHATDGPVDTTDKSHAEERSRDPKPTVFTKRDPSKRSHKPRPQGGNSQRLYQQAYKTGT